MSILPIVDPGIGMRSQIVEYIMVSDWPNELSSPEQFHDSPHSTWWWIGDSLQLEMFSSRLTHIRAYSVFLV